MHETSDLPGLTGSTVTAEELGDRVRSVLGARCESVEEIAVVSEANYLDLPPAARARLGISSHQKNVLLRLVIRDLERTLTSGEANQLRDDVYAAVHEGSVKSWACARSYIADQ